MRCTGSRPGRKTSPAGRKRDLEERLGHRRGAGRAPWRARAHLDLLAARWSGAPGAPGRRPAVPGRRRARGALGPAHERAQHVTGGEQRVHRRRVTTRRPLRSWSSSPRARGEVGDLVQPEHGAIALSVCALLKIRFSSSASRDCPPGGGVRIRVRGSSAASSRRPAATVCAQRVLRSSVGGRHRLGIGGRTGALEGESPHPARVSPRSPSRFIRASIAEMDSRSAPSPRPVDRTAPRASSMSGTGGRNGSRPSTAARPASASSLGGGHGRRRGSEQQHLFHVLAGLGIRGNTLEGVHGPLARVVRRDGAREIAGGTGRSDGGDGARRPRCSPGHRIRFSRCRAFAVRGMSCISPCAPLAETARGL